MTYMEYVIIYILQNVFLINLKYIHITIKSIIAWYQKYLYNMAERKRFPNLNQVAFVCNPNQTI